jgi:hypothetical protein
VAPPKAGKQALASLRLVESWERDDLQEPLMGFAKGRNLRFALRLIGCGVSSRVC